LGIRLNQCFSIKKIEYFMEGKEMKNAKKMSLSIMVKDQYNNSWSVHQEDDNMIVVKKNRLVMTTRLMDKKVSPSVLIKELKRSADDNFCVLSL